MGWVQYMMGFVVIIAPILGYSEMIRRQDDHLSFSPKRHLEDIVFPLFETRIVGKKPRSLEEYGREATVVYRQDIQERLPRSAPDALKFEPGVFIQQSAHGQASPYIRGRTGQQTVILFDGIRLNNSTFRQGPNQYFFTVDSRTVDRIEVLRGGASTIYGTDAIGGIIDAKPIEPIINDEKRFVFSPGLMFRVSSADGEIGGRVQGNASILGHVGWFGGIGYRRVGLLESGGQVLSSITHEPAQVPRFLDDGRTQLGTGFKELTWDSRLVWRIQDIGNIILGIYDYREFDAPRTDQCPPAFAPKDECMRYLEQFRTLAYLSFDGNLGFLARSSRFTLSYQLQHERRIRERPFSSIENGGRDDVHSIGLLGRFESASIKIGKGASMLLRYGADLYMDFVRSQAWMEFTDTKVVVRFSRGQYIDGSTYTWGGGYVQTELELWDKLILRTGARLSVINAHAEQDVESGTNEISKLWPVLVGHGGIEFHPISMLSFLLNVDWSFRAPNLDDMTSRQQTGPGFQFENSNLKPEGALTIEGGVRVRSNRIEAEGWVYRSALYDAIERSPKSTDQCPPSTPQCNASWSRFQLVNLSRPGKIIGAEGYIRLFLPWYLDIAVGLAWAKGDVPNPANPKAMMPISRIPPLNGTGELFFRHPKGLWTGLALRWALKQDRLSIADQSDSRIPVGGTPGFYVLDLRAGYRMGKRLVFGAIFENITDQAYRYHGSSVNGPGRGVIFSMEANL